MLANALLFPRFVGMLATADPLFRKSQSDYTSLMDDIGGFRSTEVQASCEDGV
jgi:hypothetical protein